MTFPPIQRRSVLKASALAALWSITPRALADAIGYPRALEGPMVGAPSPSGITIWARCSGSFDVQVEVSRNRSMSDSRISDPVRSSSASDYCVQVPIDGLEPSTEYYYRLKFDGGYDRYMPLPFSTRTAPAGQADFRVAFGSCTRMSTDPVQRMFTTIHQLEPDMFLWLGDNIYSDSEEPATLSDQYRRQRAVERLQPLIRSTPSLAIWDDHDFGYNDTDRFNPFREQSLSLFKSFWANPSYGLPDTPGIFFKQSYGGIDFFFLDGRYHRDTAPSPDGPDKTMLGAVQKAWLKDELRASTAPFKVLVSGTGWSMAEEVGGDSWAVFRHERDEIFNFIRDEGITGVLGISGDSHMGELNCIPWSEHGGYDFYDLCSSPLAQLPDMDFLDQMPEVRVRGVYTRSVNVGVLSFTWEPQPTLTFTLHNVLGTSVWDPLVLTEDDLRNGVESWPGKIDPDERVRLDRFKAGGAYYSPDDAD